jgi:hypothetical protein
MPKRRSRAAVTVVSAPTSSFPDFSAFSNLDGTSKSGNKDRKERNNHINDNLDNDNKKGIDIDFDETVQEIRTLGSTQFTGKQKRKYQDEQYKTLTGREKKKHKVPLNIVRGIKKKAVIREKRWEEEIKESGVVTANTKRKVNKGYSEQKRTDSRIHGPAPDIGFTKGGVLSVRKGKR